MTELKVTRMGDEPREVTAVHVEAHGGQSQRQPPQPCPRREPPGAAELAVALSEGGRSAMAAQYETDAGGTVHIRIVDLESNETVALLTPEELRVLAEQTGLPAGLLFKAES